MENDCFGALGIHAASGPGPRLIQKVSTLGIFDVWPGVTCPA